MSAGRPARHRQARVRELRRRRLRVGARARRRRPTRVRRPDRAPRPRRLRHMDLAELGELELRRRRHPGRRAGRTRARPLHAPALRRPDASSSAPACGSSPPRRRQGARWRPSASRIPGASSPPRGTTSPPLQAPAATTASGLNTVEWDVLEQTQDMYDAGKQRLPHPRPGDERRQGSTRSTAARRGPSRPSSCSCSTTPTGRRRCRPATARRTRSSSSPTATAG